MPGFCTENTITEAASAVAVVNTPILSESLNSDQQKWFKDSSKQVPIDLRAIEIDVLSVGDGRPFGNLTLAGGHIVLTWKIANSAPGNIEACHRFVYGDSQDIDGTSEYLGNGILIEIDGTTGSVTLKTSISGLPALFMCQHEHGTTFATSVAPLLSRMGANRKFDLRTIRDLASAGRPTAHRTLFDGVEQVAPGTKLKICENGKIEKLQCFSPEPVHFDSLDAYIEAQCAAMRSALCRMDLSGSVLWLTAGLDSRAILAALVEQGRCIDAVTLCGRNPSIDGLRAAQLAKAYGFEHTLVTLDAGFQRDLPDLCLDASVRSGGLLSFEDTPDLYLYRQLAGRFRARLSGTLGNQVGRSATEGIGLRNADIDILMPEFISNVDEDSRLHWMLREANGRAISDPGFLIQDENRCSLIANSSLSSSVCLQQSPYADNQLITHKFAEPRNDDYKNLSSVRLADLHHRIFGAPLSQSFQRQMIVDAGGFVSKCPINLGWCAAGGFSANGRWLGMLALLDIGLSSFSQKLPLAARIRDCLGVADYGGVHRARYLYLPEMQEFVVDTLQSQAVRDSGIFDTARLEPIVTSDFADPRSYSTILFALNLALAYQNFLRH